MIGINPNPHGGGYGDREKENGRGITAQYVSTQAGQQNKSTGTFSVVSKYRVIIKIADTIQTVIVCLRSLAGKNSPGVA